MRLGSVVVAAGALALAIAGCSSGPRSTPRPAPDRVCAGRTCISLDRFTAHLQKDLAGRVVGSVVLVGVNRVLATGYARTVNDPPAEPMGPAVPVNTASVGKMFTTIAVLKALSARHLTPDAPIAPFLPPAWTRGPGVESITFKQLLTHRTGFRDDSGLAGLSENAARTQIEEGIDPAAQEEPFYDNINFAIFRDLLPRLLAGPGAGPSSRAASDQAFLADIQRVVFDPVAVTDAHCGRADHEMLAYPTLTSLSGKDHGVAADGLPSACSFGGTTLSSASIRQVLIGLQDGKLLTTAERAELDRDCLGWACSVTGQDHFRGKSGDLDNGTVSLHTFAGLVLGTVPVVIAVNSSPGENLAEMVGNAISDATTS